MRGYEFLVPSFEFLVPPKGTLLVGTSKPRIQHPEPRAILQEGIGRYEPWALKEYNGSGRKSRTKCFHAMPDLLLLGVCPWAFSYLDISPLSPYTLIAQGSGSPVGLRPEWQAPSPQPLANR